MQLRKRAPDRGIGRAGEPAGRCGGSCKHVAAQHLGEQHFGQTRSDDVAPRPRPGDLLDGVADMLSSDSPCGSAAQMHAHHARQAREHGL